MELGEDAWTSAATCALPTSGNASASSRLIASAVRPPSRASQTARPNAVELDELRSLSVDQGRAAIHDLRENSWLRWKTVIVEA